jgi:type II secretory pathway pseudopilin PulG
MSADFSYIQPQPQTRKGLAIASLVLGIVSIPTLGLLGVGAITAIVLGAIALSRSKKDPAIYGGKGMAMAGIITSVASLLLIPVLGILAAILVPQMIHGSQYGRETAAIQTLRAIHNSEMNFESMNSRFATLEELAESSLINRNYAGGNAVSGYVYSSSGVSQETYCVHAVRAGDSVARRDFIVCEDGIIRFVESKTPGLLKRGEGAQLGSSFNSR